MPKAKKPAPFMVFVKERYPHLELNVAISKAAKEWENMSTDQKGVYKDKCRTVEIFDVKPREKLTTQGVPISFLENEKQSIEKKNRCMKAEVEDIVSSGRNTGDLADTKFNFVSVNYFSKNLEGSVYTPAEIALSVYSLREGIINRYHSLVNPGTLPFGQAYETKIHSETTHQLGIPPDVQGERNLGKLYLDCIDFIRENNKCGSALPPVFTHQDTIKIVESVFDFLKSSCFDDDDDEDGLYSKLRIYPIHHLFYVLKKTTSEIGEIKPPESIHITNAYLDKDMYEYETDIACSTHEENDRSKYCALSCVTRWAYTFSDHMCKDLALNMEPGHHVPKNADVVVRNDRFDDEDCFEASTIPLLKIEKSYANYDDFPSLGEPKKKNYKAKDFATTSYSSYNIEDDDDDDDDKNKMDNPWSRVNRNKKIRSPGKDSFSIDLGEEAFKAPGFSRGRGLAIKKENKKIMFSNGRGLKFGD